MLAHVLALVIGLGSLTMYAAAFLLPVIHRKSDFIWSGVGLFYALVLWVCAGQIRGGLLLGQTASVALLGWLGWQTLKLRWELLPIADRPPLAAASSTPELLQTAIAWVRARWNDLLDPTARTQLQQQVNRTVTTLKGVAAPSPNLDLQRPKSPPPAAAPDPGKALPEYELVEPEPIAPPPVAAPAVPVPSVQPATLKNRPPATPGTSSIETARAVLASLTAGGQQLWRNLSGRKPKRPTIVLDRTKPAAAEPPLPETGLEDDFDFDSAAPAVNDAGELAPEVAAEDIAAAIAAPEVVVEETLILTDEFGDVVVVEETLIVAPEVAEIVEAVAPEGVAEPLALTDEFGDPVETPAPDPVTEAGAEPLALTDEFGDPIETSTPDPVAETAAVTSELVPPHPPDPDQVAEAVADAEAKDLPADPPPSAPTSPAEFDEIHPG